MHTRNAALITAGLLTAVLAGPALGQRRPIVIGVDGAAAYHEVKGSSNFFEVSGPVGGVMTTGPLQGLRIGFFLSDRISFEPSIGFAMLNDEEDDNVTRIGLSSSILFHTAGAVKGPFVGLGGNYTALDYGTTNTQFGAHGLVGDNFEVAPQFYVRLAGGAGHFFENNDMLARWTYFVTLGISYAVGGTTSLAMSSH